MTNPQPDLQRRVDAVQASMQAAIAQADAFTRDLAASRAALTSATQAAASGPQANRARQLLTRLDALETQVNALPAGSPIDKAQVRAQIAALRQQTQAVLTSIEALDRSRASLAALQTRQAALDAKAAEVATTRQKASQVLSDANKLEADIAATPAATLMSLAAARAVAVRDVSAELAATAQGGYPTRPLAAIRRVIIHHTALPAGASPQEVARRAVAAGRPAIPYHYLVTGDGAVYRTQALDVQTNQSRVAAVDADGVAVAFGGDFDLAVPSPAQLEAGAALLARLLTELNLDVTAIHGRSELEGGTTSPGMQWAQGVRWRDDLLALVAERPPA